MLRKLIIFIVILILPALSIAENFKITKNTSLIRKPLTGTTIIITPIFTLIEGTKVEVLETKSYNKIPHF